MAAQLAGRLGQSLEIGCRFDAQILGCGQGAVTDKTIGQPRFDILFESVLGVAGIVQIGVVLQIGDHLLRRRTGSIQQGLRLLEIGPVGGSDGVGTMADQRPGALQGCIAGDGLGLELGPDLFDDLCQFFHSDSSFPCQTPRRSSPEGPGRCGGGALPGRIVPQRALFDKGRVGRTRSSWLAAAGRGLLQADRARRVAPGVRAQTTCRLSNTAV